MATKFGLFLQKKIQIASFSFLDGIEPFLDRQFTMTALQKVFLHFWFRPLSPKFTPQNLHKIAYNSACTTDRPEMFGPTRGFSGMAASMDPCTMLRGRPLLMATKFGLGAEIQSPTGLLRLVFALLSTSLRFCTLIRLFRVLLSFEKLYYIIFMLVYYILYYAILCYIRPIVCVMMSPIFSWGNCIQSGPKNLAPFFSVGLRLNYQILTDVQNYFTIRIRRKFVIMSLLKIPPQLECVAALPCKMSVS